MKQLVIIGISEFGKRMLEELEHTGAEVMVIDRDEGLIEQYKDRVAAAYVANILNEETIRRLIPPAVDAAIVALGREVEASILVTNYLKKLGVKKIIARAESDEHGEILDLVGATQVVFPTREAAKRIAPGLISSDLFNYLPISNGLVIAEVKVPREFHGQTLVEADLRRRYSINIIAIRKDVQGEFEFVLPDHRLEPDDILLIVGRDHELTRFSGITPAVKRERSGFLFRSVFGRKPRRTS